MENSEPLIAALFLAQLVASLITQMWNKPKTLATAEKIESEAEEREATAEIKRLEAINSLLGTIEKFSAYVDRLIVERGAQDKRIDMLTDSLREMDRKLAERDEKIAALETSIAEKEKRIAELEAEAVKHSLERMELDQLRKDVARLQKENEALRKQIAELKAPPVAGGEKETPPLDPLPIHREGEKKEKAPASANNDDKKAVATEKKGTVGPAE